MQAIDDLTRKAAFTCSLRQVLHVLFTVLHSRPSSTAFTSRPSHVCFDFCLEIKMTDNDENIHSFAIAGLRVHGISIISCVDFDHLLTTITINQKKHRSYPSVPAKMTELYPVTICLHSPNNLFLPGKSSVQKKAKNQEICGRTICCRQPRGRWVGPITFRAHRDIGHVCDLFQVTKPADYVLRDQEKKISRWPGQRLLPGTLCTWTLPKIR